jgi:hypothetical protein
MQIDAEEVLRVQLLTADGKAQAFQSDLLKALATADATAASVTAAVADGKLTLSKDGTTVEVQLDEGQSVRSAVTGFGDKTWAIISTPSGDEVHAYAANGDFLRRLNYETGEPTPKLLLASQRSESIALLEENDREQRLRVLTLTQSAPTPDAESVSLWKTILQKRIAKTDTFQVAMAVIGRSEPLTPLNEITLKTKPNPLVEDAPERLRAVVDFDEKGAVLKTSEGLPLLRLTDTPGLKWVQLVKEKKGVKFFQGDGFVVEEFHILKPENIMGFDAGEYTLRK